jgi:hypothetical protein
LGFPEAQIVRSGEQPPQNILKSSGLTADDIDTVKLTRLHTPRPTSIFLETQQICISRKGWIDYFQAPYCHWHVSGAGGSQRR